MADPPTARQHPAAAWAGENVDEILEVLDAANRQADSEETTADELHQLQQGEQRPMWLSQTDNALSHLANSAIAGNNASLKRSLAYMQDHQVSQLLRHCVTAGHVALALALLPDVSNVDQTDADGRGETALMLAASVGHHELVTALLERGASVRAVDSQGWTALSWACRKGQLRVARLLLDREADAGHQDLLGRSCLQLAKEFKQKQFERLLVDEAVRMDLRAFEPGDDTPADRIFSEAQDEEQSLQLHQLLNEAGFTQERAQCLQRFADFVQQLSLSLFQDYWTMTGSYADGWANSLVQVNARTGADSDIDWTIMIPTSFHLEGGCNCKDLEQQGVKRLKVTQGHAQVEVGTGSQPAVAAAACGARPAQDTCYAYQCCSNYCKQATEQLLELGREDNHSNRVHLRHLPDNLSTPGLKSYNAKTIMFFMLKRHGMGNESMWQPKNLIKLLKESLDMMLSFIDSNSSPDECMPHFFMPDAPLYFKNAGLGGDFENTKSMVRYRLRELRCDIGKVIPAQLPMQPLLSQDFYFHPFTLLPLMQPCHVLKLSGDCGTTHYAETYSVLYFCVKELQSDSFDKVHLMERLSLLRDLPWCKSAALCITAMAHLKFKDSAGAASVMGELVGHRVMDGLKMEHCGKRTGFTIFLQRCQSHKLDWAWRFCLPWTSEPRFSFLPEITRTLLTARLTQPRSSHLYLNFRCLSWSLQAELLGRVDTAGWITELRDDPDLEELLTVAHYSACRDVLQFCLQQMETVRDDRRVAMETLDEERIEWVKGKLFSLSGQQVDS